MFEDVHYDAQAKGGAREAARRQVTCLPGISVATDCESCMQWHIEQAAAARKVVGSWPRGSGGSALAVVARGVRLSALAVGQPIRA